MAARRPDTPLEADAVSGQVRGSSLLLTGRILALAINAALQIVIVRYLSKTAYGSFAYALSIVLVAESFATFGLDRAITRFVPMYQERAEYGKIAGTLLLVAGTILSLGIVLVLGVQALQQFLEGSVIKTREAVEVLGILIALAPIQAFDAALMGLFAVLGRPRAIFLRTYVAAPALRVAGVLLVVLTHGGASSLAVAYVIAGALGVMIFAFVLVQTLRADGLLRRLIRSRIVVPAREILALTVPLLTTDLAWVVLLASDAVLLGHFRGTEAVANFRVAQPPAELNIIVLSSFTLLFIPVAARFFARGNTAQVSELYWRTAAWIAVASFPLFALTFALAGPVIDVLYGARYSDSATYLAILAVGYYFQAAFGFNGTTLMVAGRVGVIIGVNLSAIIINLGLNLALIPTYGARGAAIGTSLSLVLHNVFKQAGVARLPGMRFLDPSYRRPYATIALAAAVLIALRLLANDSDAVAYFASLAASVAVVGLNRDVLRLGETFPELSRVPGLRRFVQR